MTVAEAKSLRDKTIGENITRLRGNLSQQALADLMRDRGHDWTQATVWAVEKGRRPIRLTEAEALASVMQVELSNLLDMPTQIALMSAVEKASQAEDDLRDAAERYERNLYATAYYADLLIEQGASRRDIEDPLMGLITHDLGTRAWEFVKDKIMDRIPADEPGKYMRQYTRQTGQGADGG